MAESQSSLERIYPAENPATAIAGDDPLALHLERYHFAGKHCQQGATADVACGAGYGSYLLAQEYIKEASIIAIDNNAQAIAYAKKHYTHPRIQFIQHDAFAYSIKGPLKNIISLETIEHLDEPQQFVQWWAGQLEAGGLFIASAPVTPSMDANPYHLQDFTASTFRKLFETSGLAEVDSFEQIQRYKPLQLFNKKTDRDHDLRKNLLTYYFKNPAKAWLRIRSVFKDGFVNKYLVVVFKKK